MKLGQIKTIGHAHFCLHIIYEKKKDEPQKTEIFKNVEYNNIDRIIAKKVNISKVFFEGKKYV
jgi:hypothetical protein